MECDLSPLSGSCVLFVLPLAVWTEVPIGCLEKHATGEDLDLAQASDALLPHAHRHVWCVHRWHVPMPWAR